MQFTYHINSGSNSINIDGDLHKYLFKIRRHNNSKNLFFRNLIDQNIYEYEVINSSRKNTILNLVSTQNKPILPLKDLHLAWCVIDFKSIEKTIASLNELGLSQITFIKCKYSQEKYKINYEKLTKLLQNSSSQCGRSNIIKLNEIVTLEQFLQKYPNTYMFNFTSNNINEHKNNIKTIALGCEGGFCNDEIEQFSSNKIVGCKVNSILRSETAAISIASIILS